MYIVKNLDDYAFCNFARNKIDKEVEVKIEVEVVNIKFIAI